jgi:hypothetical protein
MDSVASREPTLKRVLEAIARRRDDCESDSELSQQVVRCVPWCDRRALVGRCQRVGVEEICERLQRLHRLIGDGAVGAKAGGAILEGNAKAERADSRHATDELGATEAVTAVKWKT